MLSFNISDEYFSAIQRTHRLTKKIAEDLKVSAWKGVENGKIETYLYETGSPCGIYDAFDIYKAVLNKLRWTETGDVIADVTTALGVRPCQDGKTRNCFQDKPGQAYSKSAIWEAIVAKFQIDK